ncbi:Glycerol uptake [Mycena indigotica]|uniref:Glycerol uptake n=1 Tax=Mycena indigotica TaxID=2126181 RepID=A0A8H6S5K4_9AGAR|nr:Glycerol uptake [Mycena indigotica]KAF7292635.1 Glycerol uptake [Mycena indigotica]
MPTAHSATQGQKLVYRDQILPYQRPAWLTRIERFRHAKLQWFSECFAEALGVFFYCYCGGSSQALFVFTGIAKLEGLSSLFQLGWGYAIGILLALVICGPISGGHINPAVTICHMLFRKFPIIRGIRYIVAQIVGGYIGFLFVYLQYKHTILAIEATIPPDTMKKILFTPSGPAGAFGDYLQPNASVGLAFVNEFMVTFIIGIVLWGVDDPASVHLPPAFQAPVVALTYAVTTWGFAANGLAANTARDLGGRFLAWTIWGSAATGPSKGYAAISALTNIPATILAYLVYEIFFVDSDRVIPEFRREYYDLKTFHRRKYAAVYGQPPEASDDSVSGGEKLKELVGTLDRV